MFRGNEISCTIKETSRKSTRFGPEYATIFIAIAFKLCDKLPRCCYLKIILLKLFQN